MVTYDKILQEMSNDNKADGSTLSKYTVDEIFDYLKKKKLLKKKRL